MSDVKARICAAVIALGALTPVAADVNPPKVLATAGERISIRQIPGYEARCFKESTVRERGEWTNPTKTNTDYVTKVEVRNGVEYISVSFQLGKDSLKVLMELTEQGSLRKVPPLVETTIPGFEKEYGGVLTKMVAGMKSEFLGLAFEVGKDYGPTMNICNGVGALALGAPEGTTTVDGTLTYAGRSAFLVSQTYEQACSDNGVRFSIKGNAWAVYDRISGFAMSSAGKSEVFTQGTRFRQAEESVECGVTAKK